VSRALRPASPGKETRVKWIKRIVVTLVVIFALFYLFTRPEDAADAVRSAFGAVGNGFDSLVTFFTSLTS
jgi:Na+/proline symporter